MGGRSRRAALAPPGSPGDAPSLQPTPASRSPQAAFASFQAQIPGLLGADGLLPIRNILMAYEERVGHGASFLAK